MITPEPSDYPPGARRFIAFWLQDLAQDLKQRHLWAIVPWRLAGCVGIGWYVGAHVKAATLLKPEVMLVAYAAAMTLNAILLAICWSAFGGIFQVIGEKEFGTWLRQRKMDGHYGFYVDFIHLVQMIALALVASAIVLFLVEPPELLTRAILGAAVGSSIYAAWWAAGAVRIMRELAEHRLTFETMSDKVAELPRERA